MKKILPLLCSIGLLLFSAAAGSEQDDIKAHPTCHICGMDRQQNASGRMLIRYDDGTSVGTCSIHCAAAELAAHREKTIAGMLAADYDSKELIDVKKAFWVIGGHQAGVMTGRAKWAFREKTSAEAFVRDSGGTHGSYNDAMKATFADMRDDIKILHAGKGSEEAGLADIQRHPECRYCGMYRQLYDYSRMLVAYADGSSAGTCSIHCTAIDLALNPGRIRKAIMAGDYRTKRLIDAEKAFWVIGGSRQGVMSIRGKWAFEEKEHAEDFIREHGGDPGSFDDALQAAFEDMWEILR